MESKYLVFVEDWYRLIGEDVELGNRLLKETQSMSNIRLVIGDRDIIGKDYLLNLIKPESIFKLSETENKKILEEIIAKHSEWKPASELVLSNPHSFDSPLFLILFAVAGVTENRLEIGEDDFSDLANTVRRIAKYDLRKIADHYPGFAKALHYWSCVYEKNKIFITYDTFLEIADFYNGNTEISEYFGNWKTESEILNRLKLYLNVSRNEALAKRFQSFDLVQFNHDELAESILSKVELDRWQPYDDIQKKKLLNIITNKGDKYSASIFLAICLGSESQIFRDDLERKSYVDKQFNEKKNRYFQYLSYLRKLSISSPELYSYIDILQIEGLYHTGLWSDYFKISNDVEKKKAATAILSYPEFYNLPFGIVSTAMKISKDEAERKKAATAILSYPEFYKLPFGIVSTAMNISKDEAERKKAATAILSYPEFYNLPHQIVSTAMNISKDEAERKKAATAILSYPEFYNLPNSIVTTAMNISKDEAERKKAATAILSYPEFYKLPFGIVSTAMNISKDEAERKKAATAILSYPEFYKLPFGIVSTAMNISKDEAERKKAATAILSYPEFYNLPHQIVSTAMNISKDEAERKKAATAILSYPEF